MSIQGGSIAERRLTPAALDRARRFDRALLELSMSGAVTSGNLDDALREICTAAARALDVERTNVWFFDPSGSRLRQAIAVDAGCDGGAVPELSIEDNPPYFAALRQQRIIAAADARRDPRTERFATSYLQPRGITSVLDAAIRLHGRLLGVICSEHVGPRRVWDAEEERFAASLGDLVALAVVADDRATAQHAMRDSEARYRLLVDGARDLIFNLDRIGTVTSLNPALRDILGLEPADWIGQHFAGLVCPDDVAIASELFQRAVSGEALPNFDLRLRDASAQGVWFEFTISIEREGGHVRSVFGVGRDITERKQAETRRRALVEVVQALARFTDGVDEALAAVHEQVAGALGCARVATVLCDPGTATVTRIVRGGTVPADGATAASGEAFPPPDLVKRTIERGETSVLHAESVDPVLGVTAPSATAACALRSPEGVIGALVARRDGPGGFDGEQIELLDRVARELVLAIAAARRRSEMQENAAVSAALARVGQVLITSVDMPRLLERLCRVTAEVLGCDASYTFLRDESVGAFVRSASYGDPPQVAEALRAVPILDEHTPGLVAALERDWVVLAHADDGSIARPLWDAYGTRRGVFIALLHGSTLVGAQVAALRSDGVEFGPRHVRIAQGIAQLASLAIANARLVGELEAASRIKSDFVATMSHELRTPLNVILGYNDLLLNEEFGDLNAPQRDTLRRVRASAAELQELIEATLDLSRLESGAVALRLEEVHLDSWINEVRDETAALRELKPHIDLRWNATLPSNKVVCDPLKLKVILKNLVGNAIKFTHQGFVEVSVAAADERIAMTVNDSGIGMTPEVRAVIFEAFRQGDASMTRPYGGVGLGLYIVSRLVEALRGRITVESEPGRGSTFRIEIPLDARGVRTTAPSRG